MSFTFGKKLASGILMGLGLSVAVQGVASAADLIVGVSWANFQEERWKTDEAAMKSVIEKMGAKYISADAQSSNEKQIADIESLITRGANALIVLAWDSEAVLPGIAKAKAEGIPVVGYDRLIEQPGVFYLTFDNKEVGRIQAREVYKVQPKGNYVFIKGYAADPNADFLHAGQLEVLQACHRQGRHQGGRRAVHRRLEARGRTVQHGADPDRQQQQGRCRCRIQRRHRRRRRRRV